MAFAFERREPGRTGAIPGVRIPPRPPRFFAQSRTKAEIGSSGRHIVRTFRSLVPIPRLT